MFFVFYFVKLCTFIASKRFCFKNSTFNQKTFISAEDTLFVISFFKDKKCLLATSTLLMSVSKLPKLGWLERGQVKLD